MLELYSSWDKNVLRVFSIVLLLLPTPLAYHYFQVINLSFNAIDPIINFLIFVGWEWKLRRTPKSIWLNINGNSVSIEYFRWFGWGSKKTDLSIKAFKGYGPYFKRLNRIPIARYEEGGKKGFLVITRLYIKEEQIIKKVFDGHAFKVVTNVPMSKKAKQKYNL